MKKTAKELTLLEAIKYVKENNKANFDATVEVHINTNLEVKKAEQMLRFTLSLPKGTGKQIKVAVLSSKKVPNADLVLSEEDLIKISSGKLDPKKEFDVLVTEPIYMPKLASFAKYLGPAGLMPSPKNGTVTDNVETTVDLLKKGRIEVRTESNAPIVHTIIGKTSFEEKDLVENFNELLNALKQNKPQKAKTNWIQSIYICSTMGNSVKVSDLNL